MSYGLTPKQAALLEFIRTYIPAHNGVAPSFNEIVAAIGVHSKGNVSQYLYALEERGLIRRIKYRARSIEIVDPTESINPETDRTLKAYCSRAGFKPASVVAIALADYFRAHPLEAKQ